MHDISVHFAAKTLHSAFTHLRQVLDMRIAAGSSRRSAIDSLISGLCGYGLLSVNDATVIVMLSITDKAD